MHVFVTGGSGLLGIHVIPELISHGHNVTSLVRSEASAKIVTSLGAKPVYGQHTDLDVLAKASKEADAVIHLAFNHAVAFTGGAAQANEEDRNAIKAICDALLGSSSSSSSAAAKNKPKAFINSSGTFGNAGNDETAEKIPNDHMPRHLAEALTLSYGAKGLRAINLRLAPVTHSPDRIHPFISTQINVAKKNGSAAYVEDGLQSWPAVHVKDAAVLYRLALTEGPSGVNLHATDELVPVKTIAETIASKIGVKTESISKESIATSDYGFIGQLMTMNNPVTSTLTREWTGWTPTHYGLVQELNSLQF